MKEPPIGASELSEKPCQSMLWPTRLGLFGTGSRKLVSWEVAMAAETGLTIEAVEDRGVRGRGGGGDVVGVKVVCNDVFCAHIFFRRHTFIPETVAVFGYVNFG